MSGFMDLRELKTLMEIDPLDTTEDSKLNFLIDTAASWLEEWTNRPGFFYRQRTEIYSGTGTQKMLLRARPVFTTPTILINTDAALPGSFGSSPNAFGDPLVYGQDFYLQIDQDNGTSRSGILLNMRNGYWQRPTCRQWGLLSPFLGQAFGNYQVIYTAGYTVDTLPAVIRNAVALIVANLRYVWPLGLPLSSDSFEDRSISIGTDKKNYIFALVKPMLITFRNWSF